MHRRGPLWQTQRWNTNVTIFALELFFCLTHFNLYLQSLGSCGTGILLFQTFFFSLSLFILLLGGSRLSLGAPATRKVLLKVHGDLPLQVDEVPGRAPAGDPRVLQGLGSSVALGLVHDQQMVDEVLSTCRERMLGGKMRLYDHVQYTRECHKMLPLNSKVSEQA